MTDLNLRTLDDLNKAATILRSGGVIAYPTEYCFGLGCDPNNIAAVERLLAIKQRSPKQGVILIASDIDQITRYVDLENSPLKSKIMSSWPGPNTWVLPAFDHVSTWIKGHHESVAVRVTANRISHALCREFGGAIVSTSANRHGQTAFLNSCSVDKEMGDELDYIISQPVGGALSASAICDGSTGQKIR